MKKIAFPFFTVMFATAGLAHFIIPSVFVKAMPPLFPPTLAAFLNLLVGAIEIALAIGFWTRFRQLAVYISFFLLVSFLVFVHTWHLLIGKFPGFPEVGAVVLWLRFVAQLILIYWFWLVRNE
ncbi:MAG TPA: hypothetical protein DCS93_44585 [Microscillaceae bacterium]|nr:hypothetical protein [Microscillaceae bacterium]